MQEQKLFFTRRNQFSFWEKLMHLNSNQYINLYSQLVQKRLITNTAVAPDNYPNFFYCKYLDFQGEHKRQLECLVDSFFHTLSSPKSDFNALMFTYSKTILNLENLGDRFKQLSTTLSQKISIENLEINHFLECNNTVLDIRFTSSKNTYFKENKNEKLIHTELRFYLQHNIALVTNYSDYTHSESQKKEFISGVLNIITNNSSFSFMKLKDHSLRSILLADKAIPTKIKFEVEGRMEVGININQNISTYEALAQDELRYFYDKYPISHIKVTISEQDDKILLINGDEGKLLSRSKNIETEDIDLFIEQLTKLLKYDYLNQDYNKVLLSLANEKIISTSRFIKVELTKGFKEIEKLIANKCEDETLMYIKTIKNAFFYSLINNFILETNENIDTSILRIENKTLELFSSISKMDKQNIHNNLCYLIDFYKKKDKEKTFEDFLSQIDSKLKPMGCASNVIGA